MGIKLDMLFQCVIGILHYWIRCDENNLIGVKVLYYNKFDAFMHKFDEGIE